MRKEYIRDANNRPLEHRSSGQMVAYDKHGHRLGETRDNRYTVDSYGHRIGEVNTIYTLFNR